MHLSGWSGAQQRVTLLLTLLVNHGPAKDMVLLSLSQKVHGKPSCNQQAEEGSAMS